MTNPINWDHVRALAAGLPEACRADPSDTAAYLAYTAEKPERAAEYRELWRLMTDRVPGATLDDVIDVLDNPELTDTQLAGAKPFAEMFPALAESMRRTRGRQKAPTRVKVNLRVERATLDHFKEGGPGWQVRMNDALNKAAGE